VIWLLWIFSCYYFSFSIWLTILGIKANTFEIIAQKEMQGNNFYDKPLRNIGEISGKQGRITTECCRIVVVI
jgi:hypothetical protein